MAHNQHIVITPVATEPITLAEVKAQLRSDSEAYSDNISTTQLLVPASRGANTYTSSGVDVLGKISVVNLNAGLSQATSTLDAHIEDSDDNITFTDWTGGTFTQVTTANDNAIQEKQYTGAKQYIRVVAVVALAASDFGVDVIIKAGQTAEDTELALMITAAREWAEGYLRRALATQTLELHLDYFPGVDYIELPRPPVQSVTSVKYKNSAGTETTMTVTTEYIADTDSEPGRIVLPYGVTWPSFTAYPVNPVKIRYVAGYYASNLIPKHIKQGLLLHVGLLYRYRDEEIPDGAMATVKRMYGMSKAGWF